MQALLPKDPSVNYRGLFEKDFGREPTSLELADLLLEVEPPMVEDVQKGMGLLLQREMQSRCVPRKVFLRLLRELRARSEEKSVAQYFKTRSLRRMIRSVSLTSLSILAIMAVGLIIKFI